MKALETKHAKILFFLGIMLSAQVYVLQSKEADNLHVRDLLATINAEFENNIKAPRDNVLGDGSIVGPLVVDNALDRIIALLSSLHNCCNQTPDVFIPCNATPITEPTTISVPGYYCLANDIFGSIIIDSDSVTLDLNNHIISGFGAVSGIIINPGNKRVVKNGRVEDSLSGVLLNGSTDTTLNDILCTNCLEGITVVTSTGVYLDSITAYNSRTNGVHFTGVNIDCILKNVQVIKGQQGIICDDISNSLIQNCNVVDCSSNFTPVESLNGFAITGGSNNLVDNCLVRNFTAFDFAIGFFAEDTNNLVYRDCIVQNVALVPANSGNFAAGFLCTQAVSSNIQYLRCSVVGVSGAQFVAGFEIDGSGVSVTDCNAQDCLALLSPHLRGVGFFASGIDISFTRCQAYNCTDQGFATNSGTPVANVSYHNCESAFNGTGFLGTIPSILMGNCVAFKNTTGFNVVAGTSIYGCFASQNTTNYVGAINVQNANTQVDNSALTLTGPFAAGNQFI